MENEKTFNKEETKRKIDEQIALYHILKDSYKERYFIKSWILKRLLKHLYNKLGKDVAIFYLMQEFRTLK